MTVIVDPDHRKDTNMSFHVLELEADDKSKAPSFVFLAPSYNTREGPPLSYDMMFIDNKGYVIITKLLVFPARRQAYAVDGQVFFMENGDVCAGGLRMLKRPRHREVKELVFGKVAMESLFGEGWRVSTGPLNMWYMIHSIQKHYRKSYSGQALQKECGSQTHYYTLMYQELPWMVSINERRFLDVKKIKKDLGHPVSAVNRFLTKHCIPLLNKLEMSMNDAMADIHKYLADITASLTEHCDAI